jgi:branched-chain amino acid aminotransferase
LGTFRGFRIFTACRTIGQNVFRLEDHLERLFNSAKTIYMALPHSRQELKGIIQEILAKNQERKGELLLEIIYSGGGPNSSGLAPAGQADLYVLVLPLTLPSARWYEQGIKLASFPYQRQWPEVKLLNYLGGMIAHQTVVKKYQADEALFVSQDSHSVILEGTTFNFFIVKRQVLLTHPLDGKILPGITRKVALELAGKKGTPVKEDYFTLDDLRDVDEAFITSSTRNIVPVVKIDETIIGQGTPGPLTQALNQAFKEYQMSLG